MNFNLRATPFSRYGSYLAFSELPASATIPAGVYLRTVHGDAPIREICQVELLSDGEPLAASVLASPACLRLEAGNGFVEICFEDDKTIRFRGVGAGLRLAFLTGDVMNSTLPRPAGWQVNSFTSKGNYALLPLAGQFRMNAPWKIDTCDPMVADSLPGEDGICEFALREFTGAWPEKETLNPSFAACQRLVIEEFQQWLKAAPTAPIIYSDARELAAYINWASVVAAEGHLTRPTMYMSKNWMTQVWSWDHCFNAMALTYQNPALAWDQLMLMFDHQNEIGALPDSFSDKLVVWNFCKPPIHGWALKWMLDHTDFITPAHLKEIYTPLCKWTDWWFKHRDDDQDGLPQYHHGNDSGWDNSTVFETGIPLEGPDLAAFLVIQMETLAEVASRLGKDRAAKQWLKRATDLLARLLAHSWRDDHFVAPRSGDHTIQESETLLLYLPLILGQRLPEEVRAKLLAGLTQQNRFMTPYGLATESPASPLYESDGYWRGPIWASATMIMVEGLAACGAHELARKISRQFCDMAALNGMAENYDALTGVGLRDKAYTWTSSVFLILAHEYLLKQS